MKRIPLTRGLFTLVNDSDYGYLNQFKWYASLIGKKYYARRFIKVKGKRNMISMHRVIMNTPKGMQVDHVDNNGLNNQRVNLRNCTQLQNRFNCLVRGNKTGYKGVSKAEGANRWKAFITAYGKRHYLGCFKTSIDAAKAYNLAAKKYHGSFARLNPL